MYIDIYVWVIDDILCICQIDKFICLHQKTSSHFSPIDFNQQEQVF